MKSSKRYTPPSVARSTVLSLLQRWRDTGSFADELLEEAFENGAYSPEDRRLIQEIFYGVLRYKFYLEFLIDSLAAQGFQSLPSIIQDILALSLYQMLKLSRVPDYAIVDEACTLARHHKVERMVKVVNALLRNFQRQKSCLPDIPGPPDSVSHLSIQYSLPEWIIRRLLEEYGPESAEQLCLSFQTPPVLNLRVNTRRICRNSLIDQFQDQGYQVEPHPEVETAISILNGGSVTEMPGFAEGFWQVQDISAQRIVPLLDLLPGNRVWDVCAAPGGKTLHIDQLLGEKGEVWVSDSNLSRLKPLLENWQRLCPNPLRVWVADGLQPALLPSVRFDRILLDVPCSGLGVLSRRVDLRYRVQESDSARLADLQLELLSQVSHGLRQGGIIVYSTCTLLKAENSEVVDRFLKQRPDFQRIPVAAKEDLLILPEAGRQDGAFAAKLVRVGENQEARKEK